jgi:hypothetical protein
MTVDLNGATSTGVEAGRARRLLLVVKVIVAGSVEPAQLLGGPSPWNSRSSTRPRRKGIDHGLPIAKSTARVRDGPG